MARIAIDPELWRKVRVRAFETGTTGAAIVNEALEALLAKPPTKAPSKSSDAAPRSARPPKVEIAGIIEESHEEGGVTVIDKIRVTETSVVSPKEDPWKDMPKVIATPEEAARVAADLPAIRPVPKPTSKASRTKSRSRSRTGGQGT